MSQLHLSLDYIRQALAEYFAGKPVRRIQVFGSYTRGEATAESDLDLLLEMEHPVGWEYFRYADDLKEKIGITFDMGGGISDYMYRYISKDLKTLYGPKQKSTV